jgi:hypothetical protein
VGDQDHIDIMPSALPWPAMRLRALDRASGGAVPLEDRGAGTFRLPAAAGRFVLLRGDFSGFSAL